jgi:hypothetical protein
MVVLAHTLAAKALADELHDLIARMDTGRASEINVGLETCLQALIGLQETLVTFPSLPLNSEDAIV